MADLAWKQTIEKEDKHGIRSLSKGITEGYIESLPIADSKAPLFSENAGYPGRFSNCISPILKDGKDLYLLRNTISPTPTTVSCSALKANIGRILNKYQLCPHQLHESPPGQKFLPLIDRRDPRNKVFDKGIKTYHGREKMPYMCDAIDLSQPDYRRISLYRSEHRAETYSDSKSLTKLLEWKKIRDDHRRKYTDLLNKKVVEDRKKRERDRFNTIAEFGKEKVVGTQALPVKYKLPSPSKALMNRNHAESINATTK